MVSKLVIVIGKQMIRKCPVSKNDPFMAYEMRQYHKLRIDDFTISYNKWA
jgi:hypothetical protein